MSRGGKMAFVLKGRPVVSGHAKGVALVSTKPLSFLAGIDVETGIIVEKGHDLHGKSVSGKILCFPHGHGSTVGSYVLYSLVKKGLGPRGIINETAEPIVVVGAVIAEIPMIDQIEIARIRSGDLIELDGESGTARIVRA